MEIDRTLHQKPKWKGKTIKIYRKNTQQEWCEVQCVGSQFSQEKIQHIHHSQACRDIYWQSSQTWPWWVQKSHLTGKNPSVLVTAEGFGWSSKSVQKREKKTLACPRGKIKLLPNTSQGGVSLDQQPWVQNVVDAVHSQSHPFQYYSCTPLLPVWPCVLGKQGSGLTTELSCISTGDSSEVCLLFLPSAPAADTPAWTFPEVKGSLPPLCPLI